MSTMCTEQKQYQHVMRSTDGHPAAAAAAAGFTAHPSAAVQAPGTYLGLIEKLDYLKALGVNAIELLPVSHECRKIACVLGCPVL
jgi:1,4-alpha-glucan branching enzyme